MIRKNTPNADLLRYELHRVWEVEGTLKKGSKHIYGKRTFFLDEDTWTVVYVKDAYETPPAAVARQHPPDDPVLRREGPVVPRQHLARSVQRQLPVLASRSSG